MSALFANEVLGLLLAGVFGGLIGWFVRRILVEEEVVSLEVSTHRETLEARERELTEMRQRSEQQTVRLEGQSSRIEMVEGELRGARAELTDRERHVRELEADLAVHARNSERALRSDDEVAALREGIRRAEAARRAADDARSALEADLDEARRGLASREVDHQGAVAEVEALRAKVAELQQQGAQPDAMTRGELLALRKRVGELEPSVARLRESESRAEARVRDREASLTAERARIQELEALLLEAREAEGKLRAHTHDADLVVEMLRRRVSDLEPMAVRVREAEVLLTVASMEKDAEISALRSALDAVRLRAG
jgi:chromosome segregation ATPase